MDEGDVLVTDERRHVHLEWNQKLQQLQRSTLCTTCWCSKKTLKPG